jgi:hypothetical protein
MNGSNLLSQRHALDQQLAHHLNRILKACIFAHVNVAIPCRRPELGRPEDNSAIRQAARLES